MPCFGAHMSIAGGLHEAVRAAIRHDCEALQLFTKNSNQWNGKAISESDRAEFQAVLSESRVRWLVAHDSYLINLASPDKELYRKSLEAFAVELQRAEYLGLHFLVMHPGAHMGAGEEAGLDRVIAALDEVHRRCRGFRAKVLLETTAGQGTVLGHQFEHLAYILAGVKDQGRLGVCLDTCHVFAAGYALSPRAAYLATFRKFDKIVGLDKLLAFHVNDSLKPLGSRVDRHTHLGEGCLGIEPFKLLVNDPRFRDRPMILETPKEKDGQEDLDAVNLAILRRLVKQPKRARSGASSRTRAVRA